MKLSEDQIQEIIRLKGKGVSLRRIADKFDINKSTVQYHTNGNYKERAIARGKRSYKPRLPRTEYMRNYMSERIKNDPEFAERHRKAALKSYHKARGEK